MTTPDGGPAFPSTAHSDGGYVGMTLLDYFAAAALQGILARSSGFLEGNEVLYTAKAYDYANAMLTHRKATP